MGVSETDERNFLLALATCPALEPETLRKLLDAFASPQALWEASPAEWADKVAIQPQTVSALFAWQKRMDATKVEDYLQRLHISVVVRGDSDYPASLQALHRPPRVLFYKGNIDVLRRPSVAVVGTRRASPYGLQATRFVSEYLAQKGVSIISGLALGIDGEAHQTALAASGGTCAVLACGVNLCYPPSHRNLYERICQNGLVCAEYAPGSAVAKFRFPDRNRIISALADATIVVQAGIKSGALRTADTALEIGKEVHVVPGPITSIHFRGGHRLLQEGAQILVDPVDFLAYAKESYGWLLCDEESQTGKTEIPIPTRWQSLYDAVDMGTRAERLSEVLAIPIQHVYAGVLELELLGVLVRTPDGLISRHSDVKGG